MADAGTVGPTTARTLGTAIAVAVVAALVVGTLAVVLVGLGTHAALVALDVALVADAARGVAFATFVAVTAIITS